MFDPTIFENLKIAFENQLYDLDNLDGTITIIDRKDMLDLAVMSRTWTLTFTLASEELENLPLSAEIVLSSSVQDLSDEILERSSPITGCNLLLRFHCMVDTPLQQCAKIEQSIMNIWERDMMPRQSLSAMYDVELYPVEGTPLWLPLAYRNTIELPFNRRINEDQMDDISELIEYTINTLEVIGLAVL